jgi:hypothetical protein
MNIYGLIRVNFTRQIYDQMDLQQRVNLLVQLGEYMKADENEWLAVKQKASRENGWFSPGFIELACANIAGEFLNRQKLLAWAGSYNIPANKIDPKKIGVVMAGNIPLVGFHDFLCCFISGHVQGIKLSSKDNVLLKHLVHKLFQFDEECSQLIGFSEMLKGYDAYIATGSNNSGRYFEYYFQKYPHIIRRNRTSVAVLTGDETVEDLARLADDVHLYFGLGCRNVTKLYVPEQYDFVPLLETFKKYEALADNHKYRNNYDYQLALFMINRQYYMTNGSLILAENKSLFSPITVLHYEYYQDLQMVYKDLAEKNDEIQCIAGKQGLDFGKTQMPSLSDYADGIDTMRFLLSV